MVLQPRIEAWLGRIGALADALALPGVSVEGGTVEGGASSKQGMLRWDLENRMGLRMPFLEADFDVWLDSMLPEVRSLRVSSRAPPWPKTIG